MFIALTEMRRSAGRFTLLTAAVALLVLLLLFFQAVAGTLTLGLTGAFERNAADVLVYDDRARANPNASVLPLEELERIAEGVTAVDGVAAANLVGLSVFTGTRDGEELDVAVIGAGSTPASADDDEPGGPGFPAEVDEGELPTEAGQALASSSSLDEGLALGDVVTIQGEDVEVVGVADDAAYNVLPTLYVPFDTYAVAVQRRAGSDSIPVPPNLVGVELADGADPGAVAEAISADVEGVEALDRAAAIEALPGVGQITQSFSILYLLLYIVVTIVTGVFFLILTVQKADALVLLRAVGASRGEVVRPVLIQVLLVVGLGAVLGAGAANGLLAAARDTFGATLSPTTTATTVVAIAVLGLLASVGAVRRVLAIDPVEAVNTGGR